MSANQSSQSNPGFQPANVLAAKYHSYRSNRSPREAWKALKQDFIATSKPGRDAEQAWKAISGKALEEIVEVEIAQQIAGKQLNSLLKVSRWGNIKFNSPVKQILSETLWMRGGLQAYTAESEVDFVATEIDGLSDPTRVIATYSCKASLRERFQQDLYWAERFRSRGIRLCLITLDNDGVLTAAVSQKQLASKQAKMAAALYDRVYLMTDMQNMHFSVFRPIDVLVEELDQWRRSG